MFESSRYPTSSSVYGLSFHSLNSYFFKSRSFFVLMEANLQYFSLTDFVFYVLSKNSLPNPGHKDFSMFSSKGFIVLCFTFSSVTHFELIFT